MELSEIRYGNACKCTNVGIMWLRVEHGHVAGGDGSVWRPATIALSRRIVSGGDARRYFGTTSVDRGPTG